ncbi:MAG: signal recognition particle-docking protein FtsY [Magnetococcales bacterium]|nr:signal recognition particle-docking protein FtsY [Magnetococcales bacterium]
MIWNYLKDKKKDSDILEEPEAALSEEELGDSEEAAEEEQKKGGWFRRLRLGSKKQDEASEDDVEDSEVRTEVDVEDVADAQSPEAEPAGESSEEAAPEEALPEEEVLEETAPAGERDSDGLQEKRSWFQRLKSGLSKTRKGFVGQLDQLISGREIDDELIEEVEMLLITADFGVETTETILEEAKKATKGKRGEKSGEAFREAIKEAIRNRLLGQEEAQPPLDLTRGAPHVILVVGVNGVGKTTTIGKLAAQFKSEKRKVMMAAGDTFRAAAVDQLKVWGERAGATVVAQGEGSDSASVIFDAHASAKAKGMDILLADTAGRLHTQNNLMQELQKVRRVLGRQDEEAPHDVWLVLDATTGQNAISQVERFHEIIGLSGLIMTKLDGTAKGGVVVGIRERFQLPIRYLGVGEGMDDLKPFDADEFVDALFD